MLSVVYDITERKKAEESIKNASIRLNEAQRVARVGSWELDLTANVLTWSEEIYRMFEIDPKKFGATYEAFLGTIHPDDRKAVDDAYTNSLKTKKPYSIDHRLLFADNRIKYVHEECETFYDAKGKPIRSVGTVQDVTERKINELELVRVNRALRMVSDINQALIHINDEISFLNEACRIAIETGGYRLVWVGYIEHDEAKSIRMVAQAGFDEEYVKQSKLSWADNERGRGPGGVAVRSGKLSISHDISTDSAMKPWREEALKRGYRSVIALPLMNNGRAFGVVGIYSDQPNAFPNNEVSILEEVTNDMAFGIGALRTRNEEKLAEERFEAIFNNVNDGVLLVNSETTKFDIANETMLKMLGYSMKELSELSIKNIHPKEHVARVLSEFDRQMKGEIKIAHDIPVLRKNGSVFYADVNSSIITLRGKKYALGVFRDITENKQMLDELTKLRKAADTSGEAIYMTDKQGIFTYVNSAFTTLYGYTADEVIGKVTPRILKSGLRSAEVYVQFWKDLLAAKIIKDEHINKTKYGKMLTIDSSVNPILDEHGGIIGFLAIQRDITEREKANETIREDEAELKEAQRIGNYGNFDWDSRTDTIKWSDEYYRIYGIKPGTKPPGYEEHLKVYTPESAARLDAAVKNSMATGESYEVDLEQANPPEGAARWLTARGEVKRDEHNKIVGLRGTAQDITARKQSEERIKELSELRSKFLNIMAHQLRTPLSSVNWNLEMLIGGDLGKMEETQKKFLQVTYAESKKITNRIRDLLAAVDIEDKRTLVKTEEVAIDSMAATIVAEARDHAIAKDIKFNYEGPREALPAITGDAEKLRIALSQLVENAVTYTKDGGSVSASLAKKGNRIRFEVKDTGIGIPETEQKRIQERFYRASNASLMHPDGFGLGLYVTRYFIEQHGGTFGFTSKEGEGSTFWFEIPVKK